MRCPCCLQAKKAICLRKNGRRQAFEKSAPLKQAFGLQLSASVRDSKSLRDEKKPLGAEKAAKERLSQSCDVAIIGAGPSGLSLAAEIAQLNASACLSETAGEVSVVLIERDFSQRWLPNYGVWLDEVEHLNIGDCFAAVWPKTAAYLPNKIVKDRKYARIDRQKLKQKLIEKCSQEKSGVSFLEGTVLRYDSNEGALKVLCPETQERATEVQLRAKLVVDTTGHQHALVKFVEPHNPSYQAAYGIEAVVDAHPFPLDEMVLMDYRVPSMDEGNSTERGADYEETPTFLYAMPMSSTRIFLEETSLTARPAVGFEKLRHRLYERLNSLGIKVRNVLEEEFCLIPMGGSLPDLTQPLLGFGGTAGLVHPATGYMIARTLNMANELAIAIHRRSNGQASDIWRDLIWTDTRLAQRDFFKFGGEVLLSMKLSELQEFFSAFFKLPDREWHDFLSFRQLSGSERLAFGIGVFLRTSNRVRHTLARKAIQNWQLLLRSIVA